MDLSATKTREPRIQRRRMTVLPVYSSQDQANLSGLRLRISGCGPRKRTIRMRIESTVCKPKPRRKVLLGLACLAAGLIPVASLAPCAGQAASQTPAASPTPAASQTPVANQATAGNPAKKIDDTWQGTLHIPQRDLRVVVKISKGGRRGSQGDALQHRPGRTEGLQPRLPALRTGS